MQTKLLILYFKRRVKQFAHFKQCVTVTPLLGSRSCNSLKYFFHRLALSSLFKTENSRQTQAYTAGEGMSSE